MLSDIFRTLARNPSIRRFLWRGWYNILTSKINDSSWTFMNYGYIGLGSDASQIKLDESDEKNRYCIQLYHHVANSAQIEGAAVLEVGCGRGGGAAYIHKYLNPKSFKGVDFAQSNIDFCNSTHNSKGLSFSKGDAESLPLEDESFDVVINVESSHCYGSMEKFLSEVKRVLRPNGYFLFADLRRDHQVSGLRSELLGSDLSLIKEEDIGDNVLASMEKDNLRKLQLMKGRIPWFLMNSFQDFAGTEGSRIWQGIKSKETFYLHVVMKK